MKRLMKRLIGFFHRALSKIKRRLTVVCYAACKAVPTLVGLVIRFHPGAPSTRALVALLMAFMLGYGSNYMIEKADAPTHAALEDYLVETVADMDCGMMFSVVDFEEVAHVKQGKVYKGMWTYSLKLSIGPVPVGYTPKQRREHMACMISGGLSLIKQGYSNGDVIDLKSDVELWKTDTNTWLLHSFEAEKNE